MTKRYVQLMVALGIPGICIPWLAYGLLIPGPVQVVVELNKLGSAKMTWVHARCSCEVYLLINPRNGIRGDKKDHDLRTKWVSLMEDEGDEGRHDKWMLRHVSGMGVVSGTDMEAFLMGVWTFKKGATYDIAIPEWMVVQHGTANLRVLITSWRHPGQKFLLHEIKWVNEAEPGWK
jgi:hypothetical protein